MKPDTKGHIVYMKCSECANPEKQTSDQWLPGAEARGKQIDNLMGTGTLG